MSRVIYDCKLTSIRNLTPSVRELTIAINQPPGFQFKAGQFIMLQVPDPEKGKPTQRAYSIASSAQDPSSIRLVIKVYDQGKASDFIRNLKGGEELKLTGPFGHHLFVLPAPENVVFVCTGAGISQHMSYLLTHQEQLKGKKVKMLMGVWGLSEIFYEKEMGQLAQAIPGFQFEYVLDKGDINWKGKVGFVTQHFDSLGLKAENTLVYLCGNPNMIKGAKEILSDKFSFPPDKIIAEAFN